MQPQHWRYLLAFVSGVALAISDWPLRLTMFHFVAFVPMFIGYLAFESPRKTDWQTGLIFVVTYAGILAFSAATVLPVWIALICGVVQWTIALVFASRLLRGHWLLGPIAIAALLTLVELFIWHVIPVFGMAQCFARVTSATPIAVQFVAYTGLGGVVFALIFSQAMFASILAQAARQDSDRTKKCLTLVAFLAIVASANAVRWNRPLGPPVQVAAFGWAGSHQLSLSNICEAARESQATILVTPELGFTVESDNPTACLEDLASDVRQAGLNAALGIARYDLHENQALIVDSSDTATYTKTHLIPFMERGRSGGGQRVLKKWSDVNCGVMICQDDNFSDLARAYSRDGTQLMLVPVLDWNPICGLHFESSVMRSLENGYAICRAASGGISAVISANGEVVESRNHNLLNDAGCVAATVHVGEGQPTLYARAGDWPIGLVSLVLLAICLTSSKQLLHHRATVAT